jgi:hypothetical protein
MRHLTGRKQSLRKQPDDTALTLRINQEIANHVFDCQLVSYKLNDVLITLAGALALPMETRKGDQGPPCKKSRSSERAAV